MRPPRPRTARQTWRRLPGCGPPSMRKTRCPARTNPRPNSRPTSSRRQCAKGVACRVMPLSSALAPAPAWLFLPHFSRKTTTLSPQLRQVFPASVPHFSRRINALSPRDHPQQGAWLAGKVWGFCGKRMGLVRGKCGVFAGKMCECCGENVEYRQEKRRWHAEYPAP